MAINDSREPLHATPSIRKRRHYIRRPRHSVDIVRLQDKNHGVGSSGAGSRLCLAHVCARSAETVSSENTGLSGSETQTGDCREHLPYRLLQLSSRLLTEHLQTKRNKMYKQNLSQEYRISGCDAVKLGSVFRTRVLLVDQQNCSNVSPKRFCPSPNYTASYPRRHHRQSLNRSHS
jgi:hypothetical protein